MVRDEGIDSELFSELDELRQMMEQEGKVALFRRARKALEEFWDYCASTRAAILAGESDVVFDNEGLNNLTQAFRDLLLLEVPVALRDAVRQRACQSVREMINAWRMGLGDIEVLAIADLELKVLAKLVLEVASEGYLGESRLPDWEREISWVDREIALSCDAWRELADQ
jgi:hypothetical protein